MGTYRRKSTNVDARQYTADAAEDVAAWVRDLGVMALGDENGGLTIVTPNGTARARLGSSWVIHDDVCGFTVCDVDVFDARFYEAGGA